MIHYDTGGNHGQKPITTKLYLSEVPILLDSSHQDFAQALSELQESIMAQGEAVIYWLRDPRTREIRYIGRTARPVSRWHMHQHGTCNQHLWRWILALADAGQTPLFQIIERLPCTKAAWREAEWITWALPCYRLLNVHRPNGKGGVYVHHD